MRRVWEWLKDDLNRDYVELYAWYILLVPTVVWWKESILWVSFMSLYAIWDTQRTKIEAKKAKRAAKKGEVR